jgi:Ran GTPase-activating protein (RanGAP) involved in mRNA processing and transport
MKGQDAERLAEVLAQCPALAHLDLSGNEIEDEGAENFAGMLAQCTALAHLNLEDNASALLVQSALQRVWGSAQR